MKKYLLACLILITAGTIVAQESNIREARTYLENQNYKKALPLIDKAVNNEATKNNAEAWFLQGLAYVHQATDSTAYAPDAAGKAYTSLMKALTLSPYYSTEIDNALYTCALLAFNEGVAAYSANPLLAYNSFMKVSEIYNSGNGARFMYNSSFKELLNSASTNAIYAAVNANENAKALSMISEIRATTLMDATMYQVLIEIYTKTNAPELLPTITEARERFPDSELIRNLEINYYITTQQNDVLGAKLEEALKTDPKNPELWFNLGNIYERAAFPKDAKGAAGSRPANFDRLFEQAEQAYANAIIYSPSAADYHYNYGVLYYEESIGLIREMNAIKGTSAAENAKYDSLAAHRNERLTRALPLFEKAYALLDAKAGSLSLGEKLTYRDTMTGLREIYSRQNQKSKVDELKVKLDALK